jgi:hypothetical protein
VKHWLNGMSDRIIGVDFDNTIVSYDDLMYELAAQHNFIDRDTPRNKTSIRDSIRQLLDGERKWQKLQALAYGVQMSEAKLIEGVSTFFETCKQYGIKVYIVSHKTEYSAFDDPKVNLRKAALTWMEINHFFEGGRLGLSHSEIYFESTRREKVERIQKLGCTHFIDDLQETFLEASFPQNVQKILFDPHKQISHFPDIEILSSWQQIHEYLFAN